MFIFDMDITDNFALFKDDKNIVIVDSFDNQLFDVRFGTLQNSEKIGEIEAKNSEELNTKLKALTLKMV
jgi:hypothetical protein